LGDKSSFVLKAFSFTCILNYIKDERRTVREGKRQEGNQGIEDSQFLLILE
jgi:hypothetical protein